MIRKSATLAPAAPHSDDVFMFDRADEFSDRPGASSLDNVDLEVKEAQERLLKLRQEQEEAERQKQHLEELQIKQDRFVTGKRDMSEKLAKSIAALERELYDAQKLVEELSTAKDSFNHHLEILKAQQPERWNRTQVNAELDRAIVAIEDAQGDYSKGMRRLAALKPVDTSEVGGIAAEASGLGRFGADDAGAWMRRGFAFTLPLMGALFVTLLLAKLMF